MKKLPKEFPILQDMYSDDYFPKDLVNKVADAVREVIGFLETGPHPKDDVQAKLDRMTQKINSLQKEFEENDSELETAARESIGETVDAVLKFFDVDIDIEEAIRVRDW